MGSRRSAWRSSWRADCRWRCGSGDAAACYNYWLTVRKSANVHQRSIDHDREKSMIRHVSTALTAIALTVTLAACGQQSQQAADKAKDSASKAADSAATATKDAASKAADATKDAANQAADASKDAAAKADDAAKKANDAAKEAPKK